MELLLVAVGVTKHVAFDVNTAVTVSKLLNDEFEYVVAFVPTLLPFNFH